MKRILSAVLLCAVLLSLTAVPTEAAESDLRFRLRSLDITLTPSRTLKIGDSPNDPSISWSVDFTTGQNSTKLTYLPEMSHIHFKGDPDNNFCLGTSNTFHEISLAFECYVAHGAEFHPNEKFAFTLNGQPLTLEHHQLYLEQDWDAPPIIAEDGLELYRYFLRVEQLFDIPYTLPDAPTYSFSAVDNPLIYDYSLDGLPRYAQAGAQVAFPPNVSVGSHFDELTDILCNGVSVGTVSTYYTMPDRDVVIEFVVGRGGPSGETVVKDLKIDLKFPEDIYYGRKLPTTADFKKALSFSTSVAGAGLYLDMVDVDYLFDDSLSERMEPWVGNTFLSFVIRAKDGYTFSDSTLAGLENNIQWQNDNVKVTLNGKRNYYGTGKTHDYYKGYFASDYLLSGRNGIEVHIFWYGGLKLDMDTSRFKAGDTVTIPDNCFNYDGYIPYCYDYVYTAPNGESCRDRAMGKSFIYPETNGTPIEIYVMYVRGEKKAPAQSMTKDAADTVEINTDNAAFPSGTILSVDLVQSKEQGGQATIDHVKKALQGHATDCLVLEISASAFNQAVQPSGKVLVSFDLPKGYDKDHVDFCYISDDGKMERIPMEIDAATGKCTAALEHFSLYAIVKTVEKTEHTEHILHTDENGDGKCDSCGTVIEPVTPPVADGPNTDTPGTDTPGTDDPGTDTPDTDDPNTDAPGTDTPDTPADPEDPDDSQPTAPTEDGQIIAGFETGPVDLGIQPRPADESGNGLLWIIIGGCGALLIAAVVLLILRKKK